MEMTASALMRGMVMTFMRWLLIRGILGQLTRRTFLCGLIARAQNWNLQAQGGLLMVFGIYMALAAALHLTEPGRAASKVTTAVFAGCLLFFGSLALLQ